jgi:putative ABC transport system permease protein
LRGALMLVQVTLSVVLLIGAGLFVRSVRRVSDVRLGYDADRLLVVDTYLRGVTLDSAAKHALRDILMARATANPMVETATLACSVPFFGTCASSVFVAGVDSTARFGEFVRQAASPTYFATTGTRILRGRAISPDDRAGSALVVVVSDAMARALWPSRDAIGECMRAGSATAPCRTVVGVAEDSKQSTLSDRPGLAYYYPAAQAGEREWGDPQKVRLLVRVRGEASAQSDAIRHDLQRAMGTSVFVIARPMESILAPVTRSWRLGATMFVVFGALALTLAAIGLYSIVAYGVAQRRHEMGVRIALGARASTVVALVLRDGLRIVIVGAIVGMGVSLASGRWIRPLLFEVSPRDPLVFAAVAIVLLVVAVVAAAVPAMRASRVDPAASLRAD